MTTTRTATSSVNVSDIGSASGPALTREDFRKQILQHPRMKAKALFLIASFVSLCLSVGLWFTGNEDQGIFVGLWVPSILSAGALVLSGETTR
jgi:hypothetical protein